jgi:hypothetical protein
VIAAVLAFVIPSAAGISIARWADPRGRLTPETIALWIGVGVPLGAALAGVVAWVWLVLGGSLGIPSAIAESALLLGAAAAAWRTRGAVPEEPAPPRPTALDRIALAAALAGFGVAAAAFVRELPHVPYGDWDAWAIWNLHARFLALGASEWRLLFSPELTFSHNEYPLLLPAIVARTWPWSGGASGPIGVAALSALSPLLAVYGAVARRAGAVPGAVASLLLAGTGEWLVWGLSQDSDIPIAALVVAALACLTVAEDKAAAGALRGTGVAALLLGAAAIAKDEGLVFLGVVGLWAIFSHGREGALRRAAAVGAGCAIPLLLRLHFHAALAPTFAADYTGGQSLSALTAKLVDASRWAYIVQTASGHLPGVARWLPAVALGVVLLGARPRDLLRSASLVPILAAYSAYVAAWGLSGIGVNEERLAWHIATSAPRVLLQPWPALLLALLALVPPPAAPASPSPGPTQPPRR